MTKNDKHVVRLLSRPKDFTYAEAKSLLHSMGFEEINSLSSMGNGEIMNNVLEYKGYYTKVEYSAEDNVLYGKIEGIVDLVTYESESLINVEKEFQSAVDDYLAFCKETNKQPDKVYKGSFNVRIAPDLHKAVAILASRNHESLNQTVESAIEWFIKKSGISA